MYNVHVYCVSIHYKIVFQNKFNKMTSLMVKIFIFTLHLYSLTNINAENQKKI